MIRVISLLIALFPGALWAQQAPQMQARAALEALDAAMVQLDEARSARDRVRALTGTIAALEEGLGALREVLRRVTQATNEVSEELYGHDSEVAVLLAVLMKIGDGPSPEALAHPGGPTGTVRAGMLLADTIPALDARATELRRDMQSLEELRALQKEAEERLHAGLEAVRKARTDLNVAIAEREDLPARFVNDPVREAILIASAETLEQFAAGLERIAVDQIAAAPARLDGIRGNLPLPVNGTVLRDVGEVDAAGIARPGIILSVVPNAIVINPAAATIRYAGPLLDYGQVVILEPKSGVLFVFAGLETLYGKAGDVIEAGAPLGLMGTNDHKNVAEQSTDGDVTGADRAETLYIEVRQDNIPEDPKLWFRMDKDG